MYNSKIIMEENTNSRILLLKKELKKLIEENAYDTTSITKLELPDQAPNWWIFNFKGFFFDKDVAKNLAELFWREALKNFSDDRPIAVGGMESGAIPLVSALTLFAPQNKKVTGFFVRKSRKKSDLAQNIEGSIPDNSYIIVVDDVLNRGNSFEKIKRVLESYGRNANYFFSIIRYRDIDFYEQKKFNVPILSLFELNDFQGTLGLKNIKEPKYKPTFEYRNLWALQLCKPHSYYVVPKSTPALHQGILYQGVDDGSFFAIRAETGEIAWKVKLSFGAEGKRIFSSPVLHKDTVIFGGYDGNLYCLEKETGKKRWIFFDADAIGSSPVLAEDLGLVYVGLEFSLWRKQGGVAAIDLVTGKSVWTHYEIHGLTHGSPAYSSKFKMVVCGSNDNKIYCFNARNGKIIWIFETMAEVKYRPIFDEVKGSVYVACLDGKVYEIDVKKGRLKKDYSALAGFYSSPVLYKDSLIIGSLDRNIYCWSIKTGKQIWIHPTQGRIFASPIIHKHRIYIGSNDGRLRVLDPESGKSLGDILLAERIVNQVQIEDDKIYIPTQACQLLAFEEVVNDLP